MCNRAQMLCGAAAAAVATESAVFAVRGRGWEASRQEGSNAKRQQHVRQSLLAARRTSPTTRRSSLAIVYARVFG